MDKPDTPLTMIECIIRIGPETLLLILLMLTTLGASYSADKGVMTACGDGFMFIMLAIQIEVQAAILISYSMFLTRHSLPCLGRNYAVWVCGMILLLVLVAATTLVVSLYSLNNSKNGCQAALASNQTGIRFAPYIGIAGAVENVLSAVMVIIYQIT